jgi:hypothetical protein
VRKREAALGQRRADPLALWRKMRREQMKMNVNTGPLRINNLEATGELCLGS